MLGERDTRGARYSRGKKVGQGETRGARYSVPKTPFRVGGRTQIHCGVLWVSLVDRANDTYHEPVIRQSRRSAPVPVVVAAVVLLLVAAIPARRILMSGSSVAAGLLAAFLFVAL